MVSCSETVFLIQTRELKFGWNFVIGFLFLWGASGRRRFLEFWNWIWVWIWIFDYVFGPFCFISSSLGPTGFVFLAYDVKQQVLLSASLLRRGGRSRCGSIPGSWVERVGSKIWVSLVIWRVRRLWFGRSACDRLVKNLIRLARPSCDALQERK